MALKNQPYLPLYVNDFLTDQKLIECSASSTGIYIRLMCLMHKSKEYGKIGLKEKDKLYENNIENFAFKIAKLMPYTLDEVKKALKELIDEEVLNIKNNDLRQERMIRDYEISEVRATSGKLGNFARAKHSANTSAKPLAKPLAKSEYEYEDINEDISYKDIIEYLNYKTNRSYNYKAKKNQEMIKARFNEGYTIDDFKKVIDNKCSDWLEDDKMNEYLRPETLFSNKFDGYLNKKRKKTLDEMVEEL